MFSLHQMKAAGGFSTCMGLLRQRVPLPWTFLHPRTRSLNSAGF
jgi:hypothetical protein